MLNSMKYRILVSLTKNVIQGKASPRKLGWFMVYGSGDYAGCEARIGVLLQMYSRQRLEADTIPQQRGFQRVIERLLDAQLEAIKLLESPEVVECGI